MKVFHIDAFTSEPFKGNPACVCIADRVLDERFMQAFAAEMNLPETAFVRMAGSGFDLRWFTPVREVDLCGHATLAAAHALKETGLIGGVEPCVFHTKSGALMARFSGREVELDFPAVPPDDLGVGTEVRREISVGLGVEAVWAGISAKDLLVELANEAAVERLKPNLDYIRSLPLRGTIVTAKCVKRKDADFVSRFFAPAYGIDEDPVTGSAHATLGPYWGHRLKKTELTGYQASKRGGYVKVRVDGNRIKLIGSAVTVTRGEG